MNKKSPKAELIDFMANACYYAQEHIGDPDAWPNDEFEREQLLQCVSYQMACFLSQNTVKGKNGVDYDVVLRPLVSIKTNKDGIMVKNKKEWKNILNKIVVELGGWKS